MRWGWQFWDRAIPITIRFGFTYFCTLYRWNDARPSVTDFFSVNTLTLRFIAVVHVQAFWQQWWIKRVEIWWYALDINPICLAFFCEILMPVLWCKFCEIHLELLKRIDDAHLLDTYCVLAFLTCTFSFTLAIIAFRKSSANRIFGGTQLPKWGWDILAG